jgi:hypothetical protein
VARAMSTRSSGEWSLVRVFPRSPAAAAVVRGSSSSSSILNNTAVSRQFPLPEFRCRTRKSRTPLSRTPLSGTPRRRTRCRSFPCCPSRFRRSSVPVRGDAFAASAATSTIRGRSGTRVTVGVLVAALVAWARAPVTRVRARTHLPRRRFRMTVLRALTRAFAHRSSMTRPTIRRPAISSCPSRNTS